MRRRFAPTSPPTANLRPPPYRTKTPAPAEVVLSHGTSRPAAPNRIGGRADPQPSHLRGIPPPKFLSPPPSKSNLRSPDQSTRIRREGANLFDPARLSVILANKYWFSALDSEFKSIAHLLDSRLVVSLLQNLKSPHSALNFYIWVCGFNEKLSLDRFLRKFMIDLLWRKGPVVLTSDFLKELRSFSCQISEETLCILISSWGRLGLGKYVNEVFGQMVYVGFRPTTRLYNAVIEALVKVGSLDLAYLKFQQMPSDNCLSDRFTYNALIHGVCKLGIVDEALRLIKQMENSGFPANVFTYTMLIDGFCNAKKMNEAISVLDTMRKRNIAPNEATFRSLVHGSFRCLESHKAYEMLEELYETNMILNEHACRAILYCLSSNNMTREAKTFLNRMSQRGYHPDTLTFSVVMTCILKDVSSLQEACDLLDGYVRSGQKPGFNTYLMVIKALLKERLGLEADKYLKQMGVDGLICSVVSYNMLIDSFVKCKMMDKAMEIMQEMRNKGFIPNLVTFNSIISGFSKGGNVGMARTILKMLLEHRLKPDVVTFSSIIDGLCRVYQMDDAFHCFIEMVEWGVSPNAITYNILIHSLCATGDLSKSMKLLDRMKVEGITPDIYSFNALIISFCKMKKFDKAQNLFDAMLHGGITPDNHTYHAFVKAQCEAGKFDEAKETLLIMKFNGCIPNSNLYDSMINAFQKSGHLKEDQSFITKPEWSEVHLNVSSDLSVESENQRVVNSD